VLVRRRAGQETTVAQLQPNHSVRQTALAPITASVRLLWREPGCCTWHNFKALYMTKKAKWKQRGQRGKCNLKAEDAARCCRHDTLWKAWYCTKLHMAHENTINFQLTGTHGRTQACGCQVLYEDWEGWFGIMVVNQE
jgi:hypothetical protein